MSESTAFYVHHHENGIWIGSTPDAPHLYCLSQSPAAALNGIRHLATH